MHSGQTFELETPPNGRHRFFVLYGPNKCDQLILVNIDTVRKNVVVDETCILSRHTDGLGCITQRSYVNYRRAMLVSLADLEKKLDEVNGNVFTQIGDTLLNRMRTGLVDSPFTKRTVKKQISNF